MTPEHVRAARGWLGWSKSELAQRASLPVRVIEDFEGGQKLPPAHEIETIRNVFVSQGLRPFYDQHGLAAGVAYAAPQSDRRPSYGGSD
jgi:hypothetical protein